MKKIVLLILGVLLITISAIIIINTRNANADKEGKEENKKVDNIEKYGYTLYDNKSKAYKEKFKELKKVLNEEEVDEKEYAKVVAELFTIDFYDLNSKVSNTDVGGIDFVYKSVRTDFTKTAENGMYKYIESNVYGGRKQVLPVVKEASATVTEAKYEGKAVQDENGYTAEVEITYEKDLGYPTKVNLTIVHSGNKLYVVVIK